MWLSATDLNNITLNSDTDPHSVDMTIIGFASTSASRISRVRVRRVVLRELINYSAISHFTHNNCKFCMTGLFVLLGNKLLQPTRTNNHHHNGNSMNLSPAGQTIGQMNPFTISFRLFHKMQELFIPQQAKDVYSVPSRSLSPASQLPHALTIIFTR